MSLILSGSDGLSDIDGSASTPAIRGTDANSGVFFGVNTVSISTDGTAAVTVDSGQRTKFPTTIGVGGATPSTSGSGISFPATASASSDANTLDDYEEGTWTPTLIGGTSAGTTTYSTQQGYYTKIGRVVTINCYVSITDMTGTGDLRLGGLPFANSSVARACSTGMVNGLNWGGGTFISQYIDLNNSYMVFQYSGDNAAWGTQQCVNESMEFVFSMFYIV